MGSRASGIYCIPRFSSCTIFGSPNPFGFKTSQNPWTHLFESGANIVRDDYGIWHDQFPKGYSGRIFPEWAQLEGEVPQPITSDMIEMIRQTGKR